MIHTYNAGKKHNHDGSYSHNYEGGDNHHNDGGENHNHDGDVSKKYTVAHVAHHAVPYFNEFDSTHSTDLVTQIVEE